MKIEAMIVRTFMISFMRLPESDMRRLIRLVVVSRKISTFSMAWMT